MSDKGKSDGNLTVLEPLDKVLASDILKNLQSHQDVIQHLHVIVVVNNRPVVMSTFNDAEQAYYLNWGLHRLYHQKIREGS